jgi:hypothetical protein
MCAAIASKLCIWLYMHELQIKFEDGCYRLVFRRVTPLKGFYSFPDFFSLCLQIFIWYLVYCFAIPRYRSSLGLVLIHWFFKKLWPLDLEKNNELSVLRTFFSHIHLIFGTLLCHTEIQIKFEFGSDPLIFQEVIALGLRKKSRIISLPHFFSLCLQIFIWYLVHCFAIPRYSFSLSLALIHRFFTKLWPLDLEKNHELSVFRTFFLSPYRYSFDI